MFLLQKPQLTIIVVALTCALTNLSLAAPLKELPPSQNTLPAFPGPVYNETISVAVPSKFVVRVPNLTSGTSSAGSTLTGNEAYAITYSPNNPDYTCKSQGKIINDLQDIKNKGFGAVRVYSTECNTLASVGSACKNLGLKMIIGVFIDSSGISGAQEQVDAIAQWARWEIVELIVVGNEAVFGRYCSAADLASFITTSKSAFRIAGYTGKVTTSEPIDIWQMDGPSCLCEAVDIVGANIHPFFNANVTASRAGDFVHSEYMQLQSICHKDVLNLETGWPTAGDTNGAAVPSVTEQRIALRSLLDQAMSRHFVLLSYADDPWKSPGPFDVEQHWGCGRAFSSDS